MNFNKIKLKIVIYFWSAETWLKKYLAYQSRLKI